MVQRIEIQLHDDLDNTPIRPGKGETVTFALDGISYEIDLTSKHATALRKALAPYLAAARRKAAPRGRKGRRPAPSRPDLPKIREWALANGYDVSARGRVAADIQSAYDAAQ